LLFKEEKKKLFSLFDFAFCFLDQFNGVHFTIDNKNIRLSQTVKAIYRDMITYIISFKKNMENIGGPFDILYHELYQHYLVLKNTEQFDYMTYNYI